MQGHRGAQAAPGQGYEGSDGTEERMQNHAPCCKHPGKPDHSHLEIFRHTEYIPAENVIVHSDQGSQYGSDDWQRFCRANNLAPSMSRRGNCWDNAVAESFFSSLKKERIRKRIYKTRDMARADI